MTTRSKLVVQPTTMRKMIGCDKTKAKQFSVQVHQWIVCLLHMVRSLAQHEHTVRPVMMMNVLDIAIRDSNCFICDPTIQWYPTRLIKLAKLITGRRWSTESKDMLCYALHYKLLSIKQQEDRK